MRWFLAENDVIRIPRNLITNTDLIPEQELDEDELTKDIITIEEELVDNDEKLVKNSDCLEFLRPHNEEVFEVAFLLPLYLDVNENIQQFDTLPRPFYDIYDVRFLEFLEGALMAIDSLRHFGLSMNVHVYDTERDAGVVRDLFESGKLDNTDLVIGPIYSASLSVASDYSRMLKIPIVSPLSGSGVGLEDNPYLFQVNPGNKLQFKLTNNYLANFYNMNILMVQDTSSLIPAGGSFGNKKLDYFTYKVDPEDFLNGELQFHPTYYNDKPENAQMVPINSLLSRNRENLILIPSNNEIFVTNIVNRLNALSLYYEITVFGRPEWGAYEAIEMEYLYNLKTHYYTNFSNPYVNYTDSLTQDFCHNYRLNWNNQPSRFSFQGFDVTYYFFKALYYYGTEFIRCANCLENVLNHQTLQTEFCFDRLNNNMGYENQALSIIRYNPESLMKEKIRSTVNIIFPEKEGTR